eukprot:6088548-Prymnesium_polylepis.1
MMPDVEHAARQDGSSGAPDRRLGVRRHTERHKGLRTGQGRSCQVGNEVGPLVGIPEAHVVLGWRASVFDGQLGPPAHGRAACGPHVVDEHIDQQPLLQLNPVAVGETKE